MPSDKLISKCRSHYKIVIPAVCLLFFCIYDLLFFLETVEFESLGRSFQNFIVVQMFFSCRDKNYILKVLAGCESPN